MSLFPKHQQFCRVDPSQIYSPGCTDHILFCRVHPSHFILLGAPITFYSAGCTHHILFCWVHPSHFILQGAPITFYSCRMHPPQIYSEGGTHHILFCRVHPSHILSRVHAPITCILQGASTSYSERKCSPGLFVRAYQVLFRGHEQIHGEKKNMVWKQNKSVRLFVLKIKDQCRFSKNTNNSAG